MSLSQFSRILWARRWIIIVATLACLLAGIVAVLMLPKVYSATSRVMLDVSKPDLLTGEGVAAAFARSYVPSEAELIQDYRVAARAAENLGWDKSPEYRAAYEDYKARSGRGADALDFRHWLARQISGNISASQYQQTNVINISYTSGDPNDAAMMANAVRQAYVDETTSSKRNDATQAAAWLDRQMDQLRKQREAAQDRFVQYQRANGIVLLDKGSDTESAGLENLAKQAPNVGGSTTIGGAPINPNANQIAALDAKIATESASLGPNHPIIQDLRRQRAALVSAPVASAGRTVSGPSLSSAISAASSRVLAKGDKIDEARRLQSDVTVLSDQYQTMSARAAQLRQRASAEDFSIMMMDPAVPPRGAESPKVGLILIGSFGFGLGLGILIALIVEFMRRRVRGVEDLTATSNVPVIGVISAPPAKLALVA